MISLILICCRITEVHVWWILDQLVVGILNWGIGRMLMRLMLTMCIVIVSTMILLLGRRRGRGTRRIGVRRPAFWLIWLPTKGSIKLRVSSMVLSVHISMECWIISQPMLLISTPRLHHGTDLVYMLIYQEWNSDRQIFDIFEGINGRIQIFIGQVK